jgi:transposase
MTEKRREKPLPPEGGRAAHNVQKRRRFGAKRKGEVVLRLLRGEGLDELSREYCVSPAEISAWRDQFLAGGVESLHSRARAPEARALRDAQAKIGDLTMRLEIAQIALSKRGGVLPGRRGK